ncbi:MAG: excisionase [Burkholderiales bacterium]|nr:excisionase [Burkholderiales bacterium]
MGGIQVTPAGVVKIELAEAMFGLTRKAIEGKIHRGDWVEGRQYHRAPDGIWIDVKGVERWVVTGKA